MKQVFINYSRTDRMHAKRVLSAITSLGWSAFLDEESIPPGEDWRSAIRNALRSSELLVAVLTRDWANSSWTKTELDVFVEVCSSREGQRAVVVPLKFGEVSLQEHMVPFLNGSQIVERASELTDDELRWVLWCGAARTPPG